MKDKGVFPSVSLFTAIMERLSISGHSDVLCHVLDLVPDKELLCNGEGSAPLTSVLIYSHTPHIHLPSFGLLHTSPSPLPLFPPFSFVRDLWINMSECSEGQHEENNNIIAYPVDCCFCALYLWAIKRWIPISTCRKISCSFYGSSMQA